MKDNTILIRLMKQLPDESYEVVGYMKIHRGKYFYKRNLDQDNWLPRYLACTGEFDRIDQYTGIEIDGVKVFERDEGLLNGHHLGDSKVTVVYEAPSFQVQHADGALYELNEYFYKITGIEGVTKID